MATWQIHIRSREQLAFNAELLPTGERITDTRFTTPTALAQTELDNCFVLDNDFTQAAAILQGKHIRLTITPDASYPFVQAYTPPQRNCIALENLSSAPDAFNNRIGLLILPANEQYTFNTTYQLNYL